MPENVYWSKNISYKMSGHLDLRGGDDNPTEDFFPDKGHTLNTLVGRESDEDYGGEGVPAALNPFSSLGVSAWDADQESETVALVLHAAVGAPPSLTPGPVVHHHKLITKSMNERMTVSSF